jgi:L-aminopeptidase/D-esterase-like protein
MVRLLLNPATAQPCLNTENTSTERLQVAKASNHKSQRRNTRNREQQGNMRPKVNNPIIMDMKQSEVDEIPKNSKE